VGLQAVSKVNEPAPVGPYYARIRPVEQHQKEAGGDTLGQQTDVLTIRGGQGISGQPVIHPVAGSSRAYLFVVGLVAVIIGMAGWWGGSGTMIGVALGWITALLLWIVRKDLASEFQELFW